MCVIFSPFLRNKRRLLRSKRGNRRKEEVTCNSFPSVTFVGMKDKDDEV